MVTIDLIRVNANALYTVKPAPYAELSYMLTTDYGVNYTISFMPSDLMPEYDAYEFAISNTKNRKFLRDYKLRQTILSLIYEFFRQRNAVMLYLCETGDNRRNIGAVCLNRGSAGYQKTFVLMTAELPDEYGIWNYVALILRPDHPLFVSIAQQFSDTIALFRDKPE